MKRFGLAISIGFVIFVNAIVLSGIALNRNGEPDAQLTMTEREVSLITAKKENSGLFFKLNWEMRGAYQFHKHIKQSNMFDEKKIRELGFDILDTPDDLYNPKYSRYYRKIPPKKVFVVLEFEGISWEIWQKNHQKDLKIISDKIKVENDQIKIKSLEKELKRRKRLPIVKSRLFAVDAGINPLELRKKYPDNNRFIILPGMIRITYSYPYKNGPKNIKTPKVDARIFRLFPEEIFVPNKHRSYLKTIKYPRIYSYYYIPENKTEDELMPQYEVDLKFGNKYETWVSNVKPLNPTISH